MATVVKLGEPKPPSKKDAPAKSTESTGLADLQESGMLLKIGIGVGVAAVVAALCFFVFRGPGEDLSAAPAAGGRSATAGLPAAGGPVATGAPTAVAAPVSPGAGSSETFQLRPPGAAPMAGGFVAPNGRVPASTAAAGMPEKKSQPAPHEDPYSLQNR